MNIKQESHKLPFACKLLIFLQAALGIGAVFGGLSLCIDPSGTLIKMPIGLLEHTPFNDFLIPGIILFVVLGLLPIVISFGLIKKNHWKVTDKLNIFPDKYWSWSFSLYTGFILIIWITVQVYWIRGMAIIHVGYILGGLFIQATTLLPPVQRYYSVK